MAIFCVRLNDGTEKEFEADSYDVSNMDLLDLKDEDGALKIYQELASKFAAHKLGKKAVDRIAKIKKNKGG